MHASRWWSVFFLTLILSGTAVAQDSEIRIGAVLPVTGKESKIGGAYKVATSISRFRMQGKFRGLASIRCLDRTGPSRHRTIAKLARSGESNRAGKTESRLS